IDETIAVGGAQLLLQGGHNPDLPLTWYEDLFRAIKQRYPAFKLHALSPPEVIHISRLSQLPVPEVIDRLIAAGLDSIPGGGADIAIKRAEVAFGHAHVRVVDVAIDDVRHHRLGMLPRADAIGEVPEDVRRRLAIQLERLVGINARAIGDPPGEIGNVH